MRKKIFDWIEPAEGESKATDLYDYIMMSTIIASVIPLAFKTTNTIFLWIDYITVSIFIVDYLLRLMTADLKLKRSGMSFFLYPFTPMAMIGLLSILPSLTVLHKSFKLFRLL